MKREISKYDELLNRLYSVVFKFDEMDILIDKTKDSNEPTLYVNGSRTEELRAAIMTVFKTCGYTVIKGGGTKNKLFVQFSDKG